MYSNISDGEVGQSGKNQDIAALEDFLKEVSICNHGFGHRPTRLRWVHGYCGLHGQIDEIVNLAYCTMEATAMEYAKLFVDHVFRLHCLPEVIVSD